MPEQESRIDAGTRSEAAAESSAVDSRFSERDFYLGEFRGRTLAFALDSVQDAEREQIESVVAALGDNGTRSLLIGRDRMAIEKLSGMAAIEADDPAWIGTLWRLLRSGTRAGIVLARREALPTAACRVAQRLRLAKLVFLDPRGALEGTSGQRIPSLDLAALDAMLGDVTHPDRALFAEIRELLLAGFPSVTLCSAAGLEDELFTWSGSGTFFTRERYASVRHLAIDEFPAAFEFVRRGVEEGYLLSRSESELETVLGNAYGVFVEGRFLAGIGALIPYPDDSAAEIASLYTLTRFVGEGVGAHLIRFAKDRAVDQGLRFIFACTTSDRVGGFFERHGFRTVRPQDLPHQKWRAYDEERRDRVRCFRLDIRGPESR